MKQYSIPLLFFFLLVSVTCDKPVGTDFIDSGAQPVAVSITASAQPSSLYKITISGPAMTTIGPQEYTGGQTIQLYVPVGSSRKFFFERFNNQKLTDTGTTVSDIGTGMNIVHVTLIKAVQPDSCTVSYNGNGNTGGKVPDAQLKLKGGILKLDTNSGVLVKIDYVFKGWNTDPNGGGKDYQPGSNYTADTSLTLYAKWVKLLTYTITYNGNHNTSGKIPANQIKTEGVALTLAYNTDTLAKEGCHFVGWNTQDNGNGKDYSEGANFTSDSSMTLYARWTQLPTYKVTYRGNDSTGGTVPAIQTKVKGVELVLAANTGNLVKTGFSFKGWNTQADGNGVDYTEGSKYTADTSVTLFARWVALQKVTITYNGNGNSKGTVPNPQSKLAGDTLIVSDNTGNLEKTGYIFDGWSTSTDSTGKVYTKGTSYTDNADLLLYAKWKLCTFTVTYDGNKNTKGSVPASQIKIYGEPLVLSENTGNLEKTDSIFAGWCISADGIGKEYLKGVSYTDNADVTLFAKWKLRPYTVTYNGNKNTKGEVPAPQFKEFGKVLVLAINTGNLERTDYIFAGWTTSADGAGTDYAIGANYSDNADIVLYAKWEHRPNIISYNGNKNTTGTVPESQSKEYGKALVLPDNTGNLERTGYVFDGWSTSADGNGTDYPKGASYADNADVVLYARWKLQTFTVTYYGNGNESGSVPNSQIKTYGEPLTLAYNAGNLRKTGSTFNCWNTLATGGGIDYAQGDSYTADANLILYVKWQALATYYVKYDGNGNDGGTVPEIQTKTKDVPIIIDANSGNLTKADSTFGGWTTSPGGIGTEYTAGQSYTAGISITLYVKWIPLIP